MTSFKEMGLEESILKALGSMGFEQPSPIQQKTIPLIQEGHDVIGLAETGSGKTAACMIPICNRIDMAHKFTQALIVVPTRELALQYASEAQKIGRVKGVKAYALFGGESLSLQLAKLTHGVHVLVATPGRLIDFVYKRLIDLSQVETLILDEADEMLSMGFHDDLEFIIQCLIHKHQTLLFSATMPKDIRRIAEQHMQTPTEVKLTAKKASPMSITHKFLYCTPPQKESKLFEIIKKNSPNQSIIFCRSRQECERVCRTLKGKMDSVDYLHGGLGQSTRTVITDKFRRAKLKHLVATDVAARGLDFSGVTHVFLYDIGKDVDSYVHRSGRTGRQDRDGMVVSLVTQRDLSVLRDVLKRIDRKVEWIGAPPPERSGLPTAQRGRPTRRRG